VTSVLLDRVGALWVGTWGGGLARLNPDTGEVTHYDHENGLPGDAVFDIQEDGQGRLWLSTSNGLSRFDPRTETFRNYDERDGLPGNVFESGVSFRSPSGEMFFGATDGLLAFDPDQIHDKLTAPPPPQYAPTPAPAPAPAAGGSDLTAQLGQLSQLHHAGVLSDEEFAQAKQKLLAG
jgi:streptogramin lyase